MKIFAELQYFIWSPVLSTSNNRLRNTLGSNKDLKEISVTSDKHSSWRIYTVRIFGCENTAGARSPLHHNPPYRPGRPAGSAGRSLAEHGARTFQWETETFVYLTTVNDRIRSDLNHRGLIGPELINQISPLSNMTAWLVWIIPTQSYTLLLQKIYILADLVLGNFIFCFGIFLIFDKLFSIENEIHLRRLSSSVLWFLSGN